VERSVRIHRKFTACILAFFVAVSEDKLVIIVQFLQIFCFVFFCELESSLTMRNGYVHDFAFRNVFGEDTVPRIFMLKVDPSAVISNRNVGCQSCLRILADSLKGRQQSSLD